MVTRTINVIVGGFAAGGIMKSAYKKHLLKMKKTYKLAFAPEIVFSSSDLKGIILRHDNLMIISAMMVNTKVKKGLHSQRRSTDIIF